MKLNGFFALLTLGFVVLFYSCSKLNEPTELGDELIPVVDNVNTFDTTLDLQASYHLFNDTTRHLISEPMALGKVNDPVFGTTTADMYFNLSSTTYGSSPFGSPDSVLGIDSVVLQLSYARAYGDTTEASRVNIDVSEINKTDAFNDTTLYRYDHPGFPTGQSLGTASFSVPQFKDSITVIRKSDTSRVGRVLRIRLNNSIGQKLSQFDTTANGAYKNDSLFRQAFRGLAVKTTGISGPGTLAYFNVYNTATSLMVYFRTKKNGGTDTATAVFQHSTYSQANSILRTSDGEYQASLDAVTPQQLYIQSSPTGSYAGIWVPGLSTFPNKVIHRAELIAVRVPSLSETVFTPPARLLLDRKSPTSDSAYIFENDVPAGSDGSIDLTSFGGILRSDNSYRFNITRYVQGIVTRKERNDSLRLYAPLRSVLYSKLFGARISVSNLTHIASGRVVLAGANHPNEAFRMRLRIIYSNL